MTLETILAIICGIGTVVCGIAYIYCKNNVKMTYKEQRVGGKRRDH